MSHKLLRVLALLCLLAFSCSKDRPVESPYKGRSSSEEGQTQPQVSKEEQEKQKVKILNFKTTLDTQSGKVAQKSDSVSTHKRLYFSFKPENKQTIHQYDGFQAIETFDTINPNSLPDEQQSKFMAVVLQNKDEEVLFETIMPSHFFYFNFKENEDFFINMYRGGYFIDIPNHVEIKDLHQVLVSPLHNKEALPIIVKVSSPLKEYIEPKPAEDGWTGEKKIFKIFGDSEPENAFDLTILVDGFTKEEMSLESLEALMDSKLGEKVKTIVLPLLEKEPYKQIKDKINIWLVATPSKESGADDLIKKTFKQTVYDSAFGAYCLDRLLIVKDQIRALTFASETPFDQSIVLVNSELHGGQGSEIATFSTGPSAFPTLEHELAHSISLIADEYSYSSDDDSTSSCKDHGLVSFVRHLDKTWGTNKFFEDDKKLAPNLTIYSDKNQAKWSEFLNEQSPVVYFDFPLEAPTFNDESVSLKAKFKIQNDRSQALIMFGSDQGLNHFISTNVGKVVTQDNEQLPFEITKPGDYYFLVLENIGFSKDEEIVIELFFKNEESLKESIKRNLSNRHFLTLPSQVFGGSLNEIGLFQGSNAHLQKTFRPSYQSKMMSLDQEFNEVQIEAYLKMLSSYTN